MRAILYGGILSLVLASAAYANEIYITQIGDTLDLDITQDGSGNEFGDSTTDVTLDGDDMTFSITQTGDSNVIDAVIKGNTYTGTWQFTGNSNTVDLKCDATSGVNCEIYLSSISICCFANLQHKLITVTCCCNIQCYIFTVNT